MYVVLAPRLALLSHNIITYPPCIHCSALHTILSTCNAHPSIPYCTTVHSIFFPVVHSKQYTASLPCSAQYTTPLPLQCTVYCPHNPLPAVHTSTGPPLLHQDFIICPLPMNASYYITFQCLQVPTLPAHPSIPQAQLITLSLP